VASCSLERKLYSGKCVQNLCSQTSIGQTASRPGSYQMPLDELLSDILLEGPQPIGSTRSNPITLSLANTGEKTFSADNPAEDVIE